MRFVTGAVASFLLAASTGGIRAADLPPPAAGTPELRGTLVADADFGGFYLRGDIGFSNQSVDRLSNSLDALGTIEKVHLGFAGAPLVAAGAGYQFNRWFRADVTGEYRSAATFTGLERYRDASLPLGYGTDEYSALKRDVVVLANGYVDLGTWAGVTPFVGAGIGAVRTWVENFRDTNVVTQGLAYAKSGSRTNLAWALHAGLGYAVSPNFKVELGYRYLNLGDAKTGTIYNYAGQCGTCEALTLKNVESHDVRLGLRWMLATPAAPVEQLSLIQSY
ncbi:porin family protein [Methylorubrum populi]|uniref:Outer membrane beta-barrel protein n=1 Tax=Methylorubrum rhodesianum TaxID=29427 RepID=A0ABU9Z5A9_9HYPH|nr:outer membrane beta-barrel protein [Methylorubrum rhodesianum]MBK3405238.1 porin family protein [Methylorubrum rhodesianum]MBY0138873.1 porin family protein [Methylorubrum populi]